MNFLPFSLSHFAFLSLIASGIATVANNSESTLIAQTSAPTTTPLSLTTYPTPPNPTSSSPEGIPTTLVIFAAQPNTEDIFSKKIYPTSSSTERIPTKSYLPTDTVTTLRPGPQIIDYPTDFATSLARPFAAQPNTEDIFSKQLYPTYDAPILGSHTVAEPAGNPSPLIIETKNGVAEQTHDTGEAQKPSPTSHGVSGQATKSPAGHPPIASASGIAVFATQILDLHSEILAGGVNSISGVTTSPPDHLGSASGVVSTGSRKQTTEHSPTGVQPPEVTGAAGSKFSGAWDWSWGWGVAVLLPVMLLDI